MLIEAKTFYKRAQAVKSIEDTGDVAKWFIFHGQTGRLFVCPKPLNRIATGWFVVSSEHMPVYTFDGDGRIATFVDCSCGRNTFKNVKYDPDAFIDTEKFVDGVEEVELFQDHYVVGKAYVTLEEINGDVYVFATRKDDEKKKMREALIRFRKDHPKFIRCNKIVGDYGIHLDGDSLYWMKNPDVPASRPKTARRIKTMSATPTHLREVHFGMVRGKDASVDILICDADGNTLEYLMNISPRGMTMYPFSGKYGFKDAPMVGMSALAHVRCPVDTAESDLDSFPQG